MDSVMSPGTFPTAEGRQGAGGRAGPLSVRELRARFFVDAVVRSSQKISGRLGFVGCGFGLRRAVPGAGVRYPEDPLPWSMTSYGETLP